MKKWYQCHHFIICIACLVIQQLIVASSTLFIARLSEGVARGTPDLFDFFGFLASLMLVYVPGILSLMSLERSKNSLLKSYVDSFQATYKNQAMLIGNHSVKGTLKPWLTSEAMITLKEVASFYYSFLSTFLNAAFGIASVVYILSPDFLMAYLLSFILVLILMVSGRGWLSRLSVDQQESRKDLSSALDAGYINILTGNPVCLPQWQDSYRSRFKVYDGNTARYISSLHGFSALAMLAAFVPVTGLLIYHFSLSQESGLLLTIVATLPRQVQILQSMHQMTSHLFERQGIKAKMQQVFKSLDLNPTVGTELIQWDRLRLKTDEHTTEQGSEDFQKQLGLFLAREGGGRATILGPNGAGKSVLKRSIKESWNQRAFYLPADGDLYFETLNEHNFSSGEKILEVLNYLNHMDESYVRLILLDEWDANLDAENLLVADKYVNSLSTKYKILETRHRTVDRNPVHDPVNGLKNTNQDNISHPIVDKN